MSKDYQEVERIVEEFRMNMWNIWPFYDCDRKTYQMYEENAKDWLRTTLTTYGNARVEEIIKIIDTSRTLEEKYGVGVKEQTAREQVKADILIAIKK
jgi:uncharacterized sporulation protein YeaH/YhbH (DUF444 family)